MRSQSLRDQCHLLTLIAKLLRVFEVFGLHIEFIGNGILREEYYLCCILFLILKHKCIFSVVHCCN